MADKPSLYIPRPVELAGMRDRLKRSQLLSKDIAVTGKRYDEVLDGIDDAHKAIQGHVFDLQGVESGLRNQIMGMLERSNGDPTDGESDGRQSSSGDDMKSAAKADITAVAVPAIGLGAVASEAAPETPTPIGAGSPLREGFAGQAEAPVADVEQITVNGVSKDA